MTALSDRATSTLWVILLTAASFVATLALACMTPFAALAALGATRMRARDGAAMMLLAWATSQAVGFGLLHYPHDVKTIEWGAALGLGALGAFGGARLASSPARTAGWPVRLGAAFAGAFVAFKAVLLVGDVVLGGPFASTVAPRLLAVQIPREAGITLALLALYHALVALGLPAAPRGRLAAA